MPALNLNFLPKKCPVCRSERFKKNFEFGEIKAKCDRCGYFLRTTRKT